MIFVSEIISFEVVVKNPLSVALTIDDVYLLWTFTPENDGNGDVSIVKNEPGFSSVSIFQTEM